MTGGVSAKNSGLKCQLCGAGGAHHYQLVRPGASREPSEEREFVLCVKCARTERERLRRQSDSPDADRLTREELIKTLDRFFITCGAGEICRRCHEQGTGCCPPTCRVMGAHGCDPHNKHGKTVFCAAFVCAALLNAISECDPEAGRALRWVKQELGPAEFRIYEMITRVPAHAREPLRPLTLPPGYPRPTGLEDGEKIKEKLERLVDEVLEVRRKWHEKEKLER